jgi:hypothetical protein
MLFVSIIPLSFHFWGGSPPPPPRRLRGSPPTTVVLRVICSIPPLRRPRWPEKMWERKPPPVHASSSRCLVLGSVPSLGALPVGSSGNRDLSGQILMVGFLLVMSLLSWSEWEVEERSTARGNKTSYICHLLWWSEDTGGHPSSRPWRRGEGASHRG